MSEAKNNGSRTAIWVAFISALAVIISALIAKWDFSSTAEPPIETTAQSTQKTDNVGAPALKLSQPKPSNKQEPTVVEQPKPQPGEVTTRTQLQFRGQVVDAKGQGVADVEIVCTDCETTGQTTRTDKFGNFTLPFPIERKHDIQQVHLRLSKDGRSIDYYASVGETAMLTFPPE